MKRSTSCVLKQFHKRFDTVEQYVQELGGSEKRVIEKVLIANNGVAAIKAIRSIRKWAYEVFGDERAIQFVVMATPEDLRANAEYIRMADTIVDVPGSSNNHNYANVTLIVELARLHGVQAVWAGWGHASENPLLPDTLAKSNPPIKFIGPAGAPMRALGDKIGSTIIAQTAGVPCIGWNGQDVKAEYDRTSGKLPDDAYRAASVESVTEAQECSSKIGFPIMIKASEGGGGKGIRMVDSAEKVADAYRQVCGEVPGSPIFIMKLSSNSRHLEVQLLADEYGDAIALNGRDCSVQRRHQKIIEEGPPVAANPNVWHEMEKAAINLAKAVGYANAGTVEYLYSESEEKFYFLELNPRLQVEHPVTEMITGVNLPAAQLQVAMGIPLKHIPDVRELYGKHRFEDNPTNADIDFATVKRRDPKSHCIAVRITAENAEAGFKPTSGGIQELNFRSTPNVWGYFSMDSSGCIHEFADSQFGHLFANGNDREQARRNMALALKELSIRGDISTTVDYISTLMELDDYVENNIHTGWLDELIKNGTVSLVKKQQAATDHNVASLSPKSPKTPLSPRNVLLSKGGVNPAHVSVVIGATVKAYDTCISEEKQFMEALQKGQLPSMSLLRVTHVVDLIFDNVKYKLKCERIGPNQFSIRVFKEDGSVMAGHVVTHVRMLSDGGYLIAKGTKSHVAYLINRGDAASGMRLSLNGSAISFSPDYDPTSLRTDVAGKLVKKLVKDGDHLHKGQAFGEIEVMKMFMPLKVEESGIISWNVNEGASLQPGTLMASLKLDNPDNVATPQFFEDELNVTGWISFTKKTGPPKIPLPLPTTSGSTSNSRPHLMFRRAMEQLDVGIQGFLMNETSLNQALKDLEEASKHPLLPVLEMEEKLSVLRGRIDGNLFTKLHDMLETFKTTTSCDNAEWFDAAKFQQLIMDFALNTLVDADERASFLGLVRPLLESVMPYVKQRIPGVPGSERVMDGLLELLRKWCSMERWFCSSSDGGSSSSYADAFDQLRRMHKDDSKTVLDICRAHSQLATTSSKIVCRIIECIGDGSSSSSTQTSGLIPFDRDLFERAEPCLSDIKNMNGGDTSHKDAALRARKVLLQGSLPSITQRKNKLDALVKQELNDEPTENEIVVVEENETFADVLFPLLRDYSSNTKDQCGLLKVYAKQMFRTETVKEVEMDETNGFVKVVYESNEGLRRSPSVLLGGSTSVNSLNDLTKLLKQSSSSNMLGSTDDIVAAAATEGNDNASAAAAAIVKSTSSMELPPHTIRYGIFKVVDTLQKLNLETLCRDTLPPYQDPSKKCKSRAVNVLHILVLSNEMEEDEERLSKQCEAMVQQSKVHLEQADVRRISFMFCKSSATNKTSSSDSNDTTAESYPMPSIFTFRAPLAFKEDSLFRNIEPKHAHYLELTRLAKNFTLRRISARHTSSGHVHLYKAKPKPTALAAEATTRNHRTLDHPRIYLRALSFVKDLTATNYERMLVDALNALDLLSITDHGVTSSNYSDNHLFINMVSSTAENQIVFDPIEVEQVISSILKRYGERITQLGIDEVETRVVCCVSEDTPPIVLRMVSSNPTGYVHVMNTYVEGESTDGSQQRVFRLVGGTKASLAGSGDSSWQDMPVDAPYPLTKPFELQRKAAMRASDTLYCYDLPALFEAAVERQWDMYHASTASSAPPSVKASSAKSENTFVAPCRPLMLMYTAELVVQKKNSSDKTKWTMQDYLDGKLEMTQVQRGAGANDVGMVAWYMILKTVEYPEGRPLVIIANDITYQAGSFGTREDVVFKMASEYARQHKCPRLFMAANSGARIGLATAIKKSFRVAFKDPSKPENGFDYIYLSKDDYESKFQHSGIVKVQEATYNGQAVYQITDVIGSEPDLGVENLKGSGLIAGETSSAYHDIVTMTVVLGRTVGIGAYLVRLGQRTIQKTTASPIILTGYQALNKLMGCEVYSTNDQLGGPGIMYSNGISHLIAKDHLAAITHAIEWLAYVPNIRGGMLPIRDLSANHNGMMDTIDRLVEFTPKPNTPYDPRHLLGGCEDSTTGTWQSGFFDRDSFTETLAGWAKTVIVGRARLGGIPMGVVVTENRTSEHIKPADPADLKASESIVQEAGCVWFPNSAYKTAQAIQDFNVEDLPLMIFANWRGFSGGQRDMFDEVLKYGSLIVDAFVAYKQPVFVFIPPYGEIRGGAWVVLDSSINSSVMEMYATSGTARGGVLEASGAASVKYRTKDLLVTMHRLDSTLMKLDEQLRNCNADEQRRKQLQTEISNREHSLLPVYEQISVQFCDLHDTPGRMKAVGVIERSVEWKLSRTFFYWRLRRKLVEFSLRQKIVEASEVGRFSTRLSPLEASAYIKQWFIEEQSSSTNSSAAAAEQMWMEHDQAVVMWFGQHSALLESRIKDLNRMFVSDEVYDVLTAGGETEVIGTDGMVQGISRALHKMDKSRRQQLKDALLAAIGEL